MNLKKKKSTPVGSLYFAKLIVNFIFNFQQSIMLLFLEQCKLQNNNIQKKKEKNLVFKKYQGKFLF